MSDLEFSRHAFHRAVERSISAEEIIQAGTMAEVVEEYPDDKYLHSWKPGELTMRFIEAKQESGIALAHAL